MDINELYNLYLKKKSVTTDSRICNNGDIYFALKGENFDGNNYAEDAINKGCSYAVVDNPELKNKSSFIYVKNSLKTLQNLALYHRKQFKGKLIGITGTNGKTTTKELMATLLSQQYKTHFTQGNLNNHIGVPLTLLNTPPETEITIIEMGANHSGEIAHLCKIADPDIGLITNIGKAHIEGFKSLKGVKKAKKELYDYIADKRGEIIVNSDNNELISMIQLKRVKVYTYGKSADASITFKNNTASPLLSFEWRKKSDKKWQKVNMQVTGLYNTENALAAACTGSLFNIDSNSISKSLESYQPQNNRSQVIKKGSNTIIMDAYNANPTSMELALENLKKTEFEHKVVIIGEMNELGSESNYEHKKLLLKIAELNIERGYFTGEKFTSFFPLKEKNFYHFKKTSLLKEHLINNPLKNSLILIKGSRSNMLESLLDII
ncbi:UDP-N-acetylmuramoyl-tripeptide--D-alanyl-D-alanine ligase [Marinilabiliaceae bacterium ANBcel2]|nr:UDP-N-acetylmuramoyl-tripeptide--D-alanyl-D-alanine ligase [Marinilabiliaceae bacterium ANBcel2]